MPYLRIITITLLLLCGYQSGRAQIVIEPHERAQYDQAKETILNIVINSQEFDSIYGEDEVWFMANELLVVDAPFVLSRNGHRATVAESEEIEKAGKPYVLLGDFTTDPKRLNGARVQLYSSVWEQNLNVYLVNGEDGWYIANHTIFED